MNDEKWLDANGNFGFVAQAPGGGFQRAGCHGKGYHAEYVPALNYARIFATRGAARASSVQGRDRIRKVLVSENNDVTFASESR